MEYKNKNCYNCLRYNAYYTKGICVFNKLDYGLCNIKGETVDKHQCCESWHYNTIRRRKRKKVVALKLIQALDDVNELKQILADDPEDY